MRLLSRLSLFLLVLAQFTSPTHGAEPPPGALSFQTFDVKDVAISSST
jgi:hypothetical protein